MYQTVDAPPISAKDLRATEPSSPANARTLVVYVMGDGRSGSTVASILLGNHPSISSNGELHRWATFRGQAKRDNKKERDCIFWKDVLAEYAAQGHSTDFESLQETQSEVESYHQFLSLYLNRIPQETLAEYRNNVRALLQAISAVTGKTAIMDETKSPSRAYALLACSDLDLRIIHLVRDPRGVIWSQKKRTVEHKYKPPFTAAMHYSIKNLMSLLVQIRAPRGRVIRVRYEDLVREPARELLRIGRFLGLSMDPVISMIEAGVPLRVPQLLDGNRIRQKDEIHLRFDDTWRKQLGMRDRLLAILFTLPFFLWFGYWNYPYET